MYGFYIKRLRVSNGYEVNSEKHQSAEIEFEKGLTIVIGGSNIGKTFIYQCIDYMLGSKIKPKRIKESRDYTRCQLEIQPYIKGSDSHILVRELNGGDFILDGKETLYVDNNNRNNRTISEFLLDFTNMKNKKIRIDDSGQTRELYFQKLKKYFLLDEDTIIVKKSHITGYTAEEKNTFKYLVTEKDDSKIKQTLSKAEIIYSQTEIETFKSLIEDIDTEIEDVTKNTLFDRDKVIHDLSSSISLNKEKIEQLQIKIIEQRVLQDGVKNICICSIHNEKMICLKCNNESKNPKISSIKLRELIKDKKDLTIQLIKDEKEYSSLLQENNRIKVLKSRKKKYQDRIDKNQSNIKKDKEKKKEVFYQQLQSSDIEPISKIMETMLKAINFKNEVTVEYSVEDFDFIINGQERELSGQGYRAIIYSIFIIAILKFLESKSYQIGFSIIDSPLNPYKMKDDSDTNLAENFYKYLDNNKFIKERQVIIFENTDVPNIFDSYVKKLEKGFFPISEISSVHLSPKNPTLF